jgi:GNAT superfamily N-acetyltransferase
MRPVNVRRALPEEAETLTELALRAKRAWGYDEDFMERIMPDMIVQPEYLVSEHGIVAEQDGVVCGYAIVRVVGEAGVLRDLFVEPAYFRQGAGTLLFGEAIRFARDRGARRLTLEGDPNAVPFYRRMGMHQVMTVPSIAGAGRLLPVMAMEIPELLPVSESCRNNGPRDN